MTCELVMCVFFTEHINICRNLQITYTYIRGAYEIVYKIESTTGELRKDVV